MIYTQAEHEDNNSYRDIILGNHKLDKQYTYIRELSAL